MITNILENIKRPINEYELEVGKEFTIVIPAKTTQNAHTSDLTDKPIQIPSNVLEVGKTYNISVKQYMTKKSTDTFDFMLKWNDDKPMPFREMMGGVIKQTNGMVYMKLAGIEKDSYCNCMRCGRPLTNNVSKFYGLGPECGNHAYINPFNNDVELEDYIEECRSKIVNVKWEGWIIKSAITEWEEI